MLFRATVVYELAGKRDAALAALERTLRAGYSPREIRTEPELISLRTGYAIPPPDVARVAVNFLWLPPAFRQGSADLAVASAEAGQAEGTAVVYQNSPPHASFRL